jgi:twitching motility protein PilT
MCARHRRLARICHAPDTPDGSSEARFGPMPPGDLVPTWHAERGNLVETFGFYGEEDAARGVVEPQYPPVAPLGADDQAGGMLASPDPVPDPFTDQVDALAAFAVLPPAALPNFSPAPALPPLAAMAQPIDDTPAYIAAPAALKPELPLMPMPTTSLGVAVSEAEVHAATATLRDQDEGVVGFNLTEMLVQVLERGASDLHLTAGARPTIRHNGSLEALEDLPILTPPVIQQMLYQILTQKQRERFEEVLELDFAYAVPGRARFRVNLYRQREALGAAFRLIPFEIKPLEALGVPPSVANFAMLPRGFALVTGPTGSGKSTTLAGIVDLSNRQRRDHIMTVEDPIEFLHQHKSCLINQREVGDDTHSFANALKHVLRQDPDIILVGEMRDLETISVALTAAETGHLVFATLHTQDAAQTIDRVIDVFPPHQQQQVRVQLAGSLQGVVSQTLCKSADGRGRVVATEVLVATPAIRNLIREGKTHQIYSALQAGARHGMHTMDQHLAELVKAGRISLDTGIEKCHHIEDFNRLCGRG